MNVEELAICREFREARIAFDLAHTRGLLGGYAEKSDYERRRLGIRHRKAAAAFDKLIDFKVLPRDPRWGR